MLTLAVLPESGRTWLSAGPGPWVSAGVWPCCAALLCMLSLKFKTDFGPVLAGPEGCGGWV